MEEKVQKPIVEVSLERELDLVVAYKKAMKLAEISGLNFTDQTKFATAISEISRNALMHASGGMASFYITQESNQYFIEAVVSDTGPGIKDVAALLEKLSKQTEGQRTGIINCQRLSDKFEIDSSEQNGTCVRIARRLPANHPPINRMILTGWRKHFSQLMPASPYDELKDQNHLLLKTLEELKKSQAQAHGQLDQIQLLNHELEQKNEKLLKLSKDYEQQNELLKKRNEELDEFAHIVSHDLKGPVHNLKTLVDLLERGRENLATVVPLFRGQFRKMENLIDNILTYSRAGHEDMEKKEVDLNKLLNDLIEGLSRPKNFHIEIESDFPVIFTEEIFIFQVFSNLLHNSIKYNDKEEGQVKLGYETSEQGEIIYYVEDNGLGIPLQKREKVFKIFAVLHKIQGVDSTGIGLSIVKKIVQEKGGQIWIEDPRNWQAGCRFCFTWPAKVIL